MYQQSYEEYIRSILGYPTSMPNANISGNCQEADGSCGMVNVYGSNYLPNYSNQYRRNAELEAYYPEIYKIIYPMVKKACETNTKPVCQELVENMTDEIYMAIEGRQELEININLQNQVSAVQNRSQGASTKSEAKVTEKVSTRKVEDEKQTKPENRESRQFGSGLRDLIKILILRELLGRPGGNRPPQPPPPRPPFPGPGGPGPGRPPFPGPGMPGGPGPVRPPFRPRTYDDSFYEDNMNDLFEF